MELFYYLEPAEKKWVKYSTIDEAETLGHFVAFSDGTKDWFSPLNMDVAIIGISDRENKTNNPLISVAPANVRYWLYGMRMISSNMRMADIGDIKGAALNDRYVALQEVVEQLVRKNIIIMIVGGSQDFTFPVCQFFSTRNIKSGIAIVDAFLDLDPENEDFSSFAYINRLVENLGDKIDDISVMGTQLYYCSPRGEKYMNDHHFEMLRLKDLRGDNIDRAEVVLRGASVLSFDFLSLKNQYGLPNGNSMPNGLSNEEACRIFWYAGASDVLKVAGLFNINHLVGEKPDVPAAVSAQMFWHFLEGLGARCDDFPVKPVSDYAYKVVSLEAYEENLHFFHNPENDRWWMEVPSSEGGKIVPCHSSDYQNALKH